MIRELLLELDDVILLKLVQGSAKEVGLATGILKAEGYGVPAESLGFSTTGGTSIKYLPGLGEVEKLLPRLGLVIKNDLAGHAT